MEVSVVSYLKLSIVFFLIVSLLGFTIMGYDKSAAKKQGQRIAERTLFIIAIIGGSLGIFFGMQFFRHKTKHWYFKYGIPVLVVLQFAIIFYLVTSKTVS
jgi:uncharacterized membrane protein YsdA (DUF1294 family)